ncbi:MAG TPA: sensor domain-containing diguanylate cyclase [Longimicrobiaceae bacterium]|nr:sensor domain-containing diguanylate cyclase [Longimicrobiaceae bacterium]
MSFSDPPADATHEQQAATLRILMEALPDLFRIQTPDDFFAALLRHACRAFGTSRAFVAAFADADLDEVTAEVEGWMTVREDVAFDGRPLIVRASTAGAQPGSPIESLPASVRAAAQLVIQGNDVWTEHGTAIPLRLGTRAVGVLYLDTREPQGTEQVARLLMDTAATALENVLLQALTSGTRVGELPSRGIVLRRFRQALRSAARRGEACSILRADVDGFAQINKAHGSAAGDLALHTVARVLRFWVRDTDIVGRWGPDEFLVVLPDTPALGASTLARRLAEQTEAMAVDSGALHVPLRLSFGAATLLPPGADGVGMLETGLLDGVASALIEKAGASLDSVRGTARAGETGVCKWSDVDPALGGDGFVSAILARMPR